MGMELSSAETERQVGGDGIETCGMGGGGVGWAWFESRALFVVDIGKKPQFRCSVHVSAIR